MKARIKSVFDPQVLLPAAFLAILVALAFPPVGLWPLAWLAFVLWAIFFERSPQLRARAPLFFFWYSYAVHLFGFYWVAYTFREFGAMPWAASIPLMLLALVLVALSSALLGWIYRRVLRRYPRLETYPWLALGVMWLVWDFLDFRVYPWTPVMSVGSSQLLLASTGYLGTNGWRVIFFLSAAATAGLWLRSVSRRERALNIFAINVLVWSVPVFAGFWNRKVLMERYPNSRPIAILQGNIGNTVKKNVKLGEVPSVRRVSLIYRDLVEEASIHLLSENSATDTFRPLYFWPETSFPGIWNQPDFLGLELRNMVHRSKGLHLVGSYEYGSFSVGPITRDVDFNVLAAIEPGKPGEAYRKMVRMPFGEYIPGDKWYPEIYRIIPTVPLFGAGTEYKLLNTEGEGPVMVPLICYEILFESFVNGFVDLARRDYPERDIVLVNPSNDSWYGLTSQPFQNLFLSRWHAARLRLPLVRPANTGFSALVAPWGEVLAESHLDEPEVVYGELPVR
ncbi:MAG TPA: nitrilase-related carbon-nitrogen hydrolase [Bdellovibrionota bacterium]|jgi:apolipoprotein N-acyltransferase|nr:nitrilase-related carbon-nitrogen hydrolase [Bdellovibrionota bacterium]